MHLGTVAADALEVGMRILVEDLVDLAVVEERVEAAGQPVGAAAGAAAGELRDRASTTISTACGSLGRFARPLSGLSSASGSAGNTSPMTSPTASAVRMYFWVISNDV